MTPWYLQEEHLPKLEHYRLVETEWNGSRKSTILPKLGTVFETPSQYSLEIRPVDGTVEHDRDLSRVLDQLDRSV